MGYVINYDCEDPDILRGPIPFILFWKKNKMHDYCITQIGAPLCYTQSQVNLVRLVLQIHLVLLFYVFYILAVIYTTFLHVLFWNDPYLYVNKRNQTSLNAQLNASASFGIYSYDVFCTSIKVHTPTKTSKVAQV